MLNNSTEQILFNSNFISRLELKSCQTTRSTIVYEVVRLINGVPLFWEGHWLRLQNSLKAINSRIKIDKSQLEEYLAGLIIQNGFKNTNIRIEIFGRNILLYAIQPVYPTSHDFEQGVEVNCIDAIRVNPTQKILRRTWKKNMERKVNQAGVFESLLVNSQGLITEGSHTNVFFIRENKLFSAAESLILPGITRLEIMKIAKDEKIAFEYVDLEKDKVSDFEAAFLCATSLHILPIAKIEKVPFDVNHPTLRLLMNAFNNHLEQEIEKASLKWIR